MVSKRDEQLEKINLAINIIGEAFLVYDTEGIHRALERRQDFFDLSETQAVIWADMIHSASIKDVVRTQQACCALYAVRCALEVAEWIKRPSLSGEQRIYNLLSMTRAKAEEARMLAG